MSLKNAIGAASLTFLLAGTAAFAQSDSQNLSGRVSGYQNHGHRGHHGIRLSPEEKAMLKLNWRQQLKSMPPTQRKEAKQQLRQNWRAMGSRARQQQVAQLDIQWRQLPQSTREAAMERMQQHAQRKMQGKQSQGGRPNSYDGAPGNEPSYQDRPYENGPPN